jgi:hypothetical protein
MRKLIIILSILISIKGISQPTTTNPYLGSPPSLTFVRGWLIVDSGGFAVKHIIRDTLAPPFNIGEFRIRPQDTALYIGVSTTANLKWLKLSGSGGGGGSGTITGTSDFSLLSSPPNINTNKTFSSLSIVSSHITWDLSTGFNKRVTITGTDTLVLANLQSGVTGVIRITQDATGSRTLVVPGSGSLNLNPAPNSVTTATFIYDAGTGLYTWRTDYNTNVSLQQLHDSVALRQGLLTLTTTGTSGASTLVGNTLNIPQYSGGGGSLTFTDGSGFDGTVTSGPTLALTTQLSSTQIPVIGASGALTGSSLFTFGSNVMHMESTNSVFDIRMRNSSGQNIFLTNNGGVFKIGNDGNTSAMTLDASGNVGINTISAISGYILNVSGTGGAGRIHQSGDAIWLDNQVNNSTNIRFSTLDNTTGFIEYNTRDFIIWTNGIRRFKFINDGTTQTLGTSSGTISFVPQANSGTYNWNWPTTAGTSGFLVTSGGGGSNPLTYTDPSTFQTVANLSTSTSLGTSNTLYPSQNAVFQYVNNTASAQLPKAAQDYATTAALPTNTYNNGASGVGATLTGTATGTLTIDGNVTALNEKILVQNEATAANNGYFTVTTAGAVGVAYVLTRRTDFDQSSEMVVGSETYVANGSQNGGKKFTLSGTVTTVGTTAANFVFTGGSPATAWGGITGTLSSQTDLQSALDAKISTSLTNGKFLVGNGSSIATAVTPTGDVTFDNGGAFAIGAGKVTNSMLSGSIAASKLIGTDITTLGTITSGTWNGTAIGDTYISSASTWNGKGANLVTNTTDVGNVGAGVDDLITYTIPAGKLATNGDYLEFTMTFVFAANANSKQVQVIYGGTTVYASGAQAQNDGTMEIRGTIIRTGAATQKITFHEINNGTLFTDYADYVTAAETLSGTVVLKATGEGVNTGDITQKILTVKYFPGN